jgi:hypothetical protein
VPEPGSRLHLEILKCATAILEAHATDLEVNSPSPSARMNEAIARLRGVYDREQARGGADAYLTDTLASFTVGAEEAVALFRLALARYRAEGSSDPTYVARLSMARRLIDLGRRDEAREEAEAARAEAALVGDDESVRLADSVVSTLAV